MQTQTLSTWLSLAFVAALTTGCGGGGSDATPAAAATSPTPATLATPTPTASTPATAATAGTLPFLAITYTGASSTQNVVITGSGTSSVMTFTNPAFTLTGADSATSTFSANGGQVKAGGNVVSYCSAGIQPTFSSVGGANKPFQNGHRVFLSANLTQVTDVTLPLLKGLSFSFFNCTGAAVKMTVNAAGDGGTITSPSGTEALVPANLAAGLSDAGLKDADGSETKVRGYKYTASGVSKDFLLFIEKYTNSAEPNVGYLNLLSQD